MVAFGIGANVGVLLPYSGSTNTRPTTWGSSTWPRRIRAGAAWDFWERMLATAGIGREEAAGVPVHPPGHREPHGGHRGVLPEARSHLPRKGQAAPGAPGRRPARAPAAPAGTL
jgi:hypothetical protein